MMPIIVTKKVIERREELLDDVKQLKEIGVSNSELTEKLYHTYGWDFIDYRELFSSSRELCSFIGIDEDDTNIRWIS
jgi:hypothetical protein